MREIKFRAWDGKEIIEPHNNTEYASLNNAVDSALMRYGNLMQYTGLKDKNDKEIYEGDIVKGEKHGNVYEVKYDPEYGGFDPFVQCDHGATSYYDYPLEVIGNIYENPELLEQKH